MTYSKFGESFNKLDSYVERGTDVKSQKRVIGKRLRSEIAQEERTDVMLLFININVRTLTGYKISLSSLFLSA